MTTPSLSTSDIIASACTFSSYLQRLLNANPKQRLHLESELPQPFSASMMQHFASWEELISQPSAFASALRQLRQAVMARLICRDLAHLADLNEVMSTMSALADFSIRMAVQGARQTLSHYGDPIGHISHIPQELMVIGMGKLGGKELNVSSDIDLVFLYSESGETNGQRVISNQEYFVQLGKKIIQILNELAAEGRVFRVDMRLRPHGDSGPLAMSLTAFENYLLTQGREWERYAWIKARAITGDHAALTQLIRPFVYRKYLDYSAYGAMRDLHNQIRHEVTRKERYQDIKIGPGGIREIEFIAQVFQLIRGGRATTLQLRGTQETLQQLAALHLLEPSTVNQLHEAYNFLRSLEHRLQYVDDQQTHVLPKSTEALHSIALSMGFANTTSFMHALKKQQRHVTRHFEQVFILPTENAPAHPLAGLWQDIQQENATLRLTQLGFQEAQQTAAHLGHLAQSQAYQMMSTVTQNKLNQLMPSLIEVASGFNNPDATLTRIITLLEAISKRSAYFSLLTEYPQTLQRLASLCSVSAWVSNYLTQHPILLDELLDARVLYRQPEWDALSQQLENALCAIHHDVEAKMDTLRHFKHTQTLRLVAQDVAGMWSFEALSDQLSLLADTLLAATLRHTWPDVAKRHCDKPKFAIIGYGKLGGKELGYASDLDLIFLYNDNDASAPENYMRLARKLLTWLTSTTAAGQLYEIDLRLRPNGSSGLLVSSFSAFTHYQKTQAWTWEHQALTRARFVAGSQSIAEAFDKERRTLLCQTRSLETLRQEIVSMRERIAQNYPPLEKDPKHARGGIIDIEFIVQYLILAHAHTLPALCNNTGTMALLLLCAQAGLIPASETQGAIEAYRYLRHLQHQSRLNEHADVVVNATLCQHYQNGQQLWQWVFG